MSGAAVAEALRGWSKEPIDSLVYTHGHMDHVGGSGAVAADAEAHGHRPPRVVGHANVPVRLQRYEDTNGYNIAINARQFGGVSRRLNLGSLGAGVDRFVAPDTLWPDVTYDDHLTVSVAGTDFVLHHDKGETDDHTWAWVPKHRALCVGDFVTWVFPNAGNPQKVQRYPLEWARALRRMQAFEAELLLPAHGLPVRGQAEVNLILGDLASALEGLVDATLELMNAGESLDTIIQAVEVSEELLSKPWLQPVYDEPEFVVRNIWRLYGGWWDLNPAKLKSASDAAYAAEIVGLAGGEEQVIRRAQELAEAGDFRLACELIELATSAEPESVAAHGARAEIYMARRHAERSLMSKGIYAAASRESTAIVENAGS
ncbi:MAG: MBL fold metallo-hydrolase [Acidimicrobiaceae bacterium]|nr:MBL fold metallo-hydrolase [Acidimicrobiaceae bacterium]